MKRRTKKKATPLMLLWSRQEQRRFVDTVERLTCVAGDMAMLLHEPVEGAKAAAATRAAKAAAAPPAMMRDVEPAITEAIVQRLTGCAWKSLFRLLWVALSHEGLCDALDGVEYTRVFDEWERAGYPPITLFIAERANIGANG